MVYVKVRRPLVEIGVQRIPGRSSGACRSQDPGGTQVQSFTKSVICQDCQPARGPLINLDLQSVIAAVIETGPEENIAEALVWPAGLLVGKRGSRSVDRAIDV